MSTFVTVHPHVCGERAVTGRPLLSRNGSSPRLWGTPRGRQGPGAQYRFIPTSVGNAHKGDGCHPGRAVHPHVCGEREIKDTRARREAGSSPRLWGTHRNERLEAIRLRFIPTSVGNAPLQKAIRGMCAVHPHVCGERKRASHYADEFDGSSPRLWGTLGIAADGFAAGRFIPTSVGNALLSRMLAIPGPVHPHVCGERQIAIMRSVAPCGSSPRLWGTQRIISAYIVKIRFIPTSVGNARIRNGQGGKGPVHPHVCGERSWAVIFFAAIYGSSPRLWGTRPRRSSPC